MYGSTCLLAIKGGNRLPKHRTVRRTRTGFWSHRSHLFLKFECEKAVFPSEVNVKTCTRTINIINSALDSKLWFNTLFKGNQRKVTYFFSRSVVTLLQQCTHKCYVAWQKKSEYKKKLCRFIFPCVICHLWLIQKSFSVSNYSKCF